MNLENAKKIETVVYKTKDYGMFKKHMLQPMNRKKGDDKLGKSLRYTNGNELNPIIVNTKGEILDGNRRYEALSIEKLWVYFIVVEIEDEFKFMQGINETSSNWSTAQIIQSRGVVDKEYSKINDFIQQKGASAELLNLFSGFSYRQLRAGSAQDIDFENLETIRTVSNYISGVFGQPNTITLRAMKKLKKQIKNFDALILEKKVERDFLEDKYTNIVFSTNLERVTKILTKTYKRK